MVIAPLLPETKVSRKVLCNNFERIIRTLAGLLSSAYTLAETHILLRGDCHPSLRGHVYQS